MRRKLCISNGARREDSFFLAATTLHVLHLTLTWWKKAVHVFFFLASIFIFPSLFLPYFFLFFSLKKKKKLSLMYLPLCPRSILLIVVTSHSIPLRSSLYLFVPFPFSLFRLIYVLQSNCFRVTLSLPQFLSFYPILPSLHSELSGGCIIDRHLYLWHLLLLTPPSLPLSLPLSPSLSVCLAWCSLAGT